MAGLAVIIEGLALAMPEEFTKDELAGFILRGIPIPIRFRGEGAQASTPQRP